MKRLAFTFIIALLLTVQQGIASAADTPAPLSTPELKQTIGSGNKSTIVFFLNPNGGPCRAQNDVLMKLQKDRKNNFNIAYIDAMKPENQRAFYDYGVRNLPSMVLVDNKGRIKKVFPPGIQNYETLVAALDGIR